MRTDKINQFIDDYALRYGASLQEQLDVTPLGVSNTTAFINRMEQVVQIEIKKHNPTYVASEATANDLTAIWDAILEQAYYVITCGDFTAMSGYEPLTNTVVPIMEIAQRRFSPLATDILKTQGLLYRGLMRERTSRAYGYFSWWN